MKLRKIMAGIAAAAVASSSLAVAASASLVVPEGTLGVVNAGTGMWLVQVYNRGNEAENKPATDFGIDLAAIDGVRFTIDLDLDNEDLAGMALEFFEGNVGGGIVMSVNGGDIYPYQDDPTKVIEYDADGNKTTGEPDSDIWNAFNWNTQQWWGVEYVNVAGETVSTNPNDDEDTANDNPVSAKNLGDYKYELTATGFDNPFNSTEYEVNKVDCFQIALQEWGGDIVPMNVLKCELLDKSGEVIMEFDPLGNETVYKTAGGAADPEPEAPTDPEPEAPTDPEPEAPADPEPEAPANPGDSSKPNAGTGVEGVALVAGIAVLATGAIVVAKKRS